LSDESRLPWVSFAFSVGGIALSLYLTVFGLLHSTGSCPLNGPLSCTSVLSSPYSKVLGVPTAAFGLVWFAVASALPFQNARKRSRQVLLLGWSLLALAGIALLMYVEFIIIGSFCIYCTSAHLLGIAVAGCSFATWRSRSQQRLLH
jgi:uncharacterized membrane protein